MHSNSEELRKSVRKQIFPEGKYNGWFSQASYFVRACWFPALLFSWVGLWLKSTRDYSFNIFQAWITQQVAPIKPAMCLCLGMLDKAQLLLLSTPHGAKMKHLSMQAEAVATLHYDVVQEYWGTFEWTLTDAGKKTTIAWNTEWTHLSYKRAVIMIKVALDG